MLDNIDFATLRFIWYAILALIAALVSLGRADRDIRISTAIISFGYFWILYTGNEGNMAIGNWIVRVGITLLLLRLAKRKGTENIE